MHKNTYIILYKNIYLSINKECVIIMIFFTLIYRNGIAQYRVLRLKGIQRQVIIVYGRVDIYTLVEYNEQRKI